MKRVLAALLLLAAPAVAQDFRPSVLVSREAGLVTIDMCASSGTNLRYAWDYDNDGADDQRGPCRRTLELAGPVRVSVWEAVGTDRGHHEETIWPLTSTPFRPFVRALHGVSVIDFGGGVKHEFIFDACASEGQDLSFAFDLDGDGVDELVGECSARLAFYDASWMGRSVRVTITSGAERDVQYFALD